MDNTHQEAFVWISTRIALQEGSVSKGPIFGGLELLQLDQGLARRSFPTKGTYD